MICDINRVKCVEAKHLRRPEPSRTDLGPDSLVVVLLTSLLNMHVTSLVDIHVTWLVNIHVACVTHTPLLPHSYMSCLIHRSLLPNLLVVVLCVTSPLIMCNINMRNIITQYKCEYKCQHKCDMTRQYPCGMRYSYISRDVFWAQEHIWMTLLGPRDTCLAATHCNTLQHTATHCNTLQHAARLHEARLCKYAYQYIHLYI